MSQTFLFDPRFIVSARKLGSREHQGMWRALELLQQWPPPPGLKLERVKDSRRVTSIRITRRHRIIFHRPRKHRTILLLNVGHHDDVYKFALRWRPNQMPGHVTMALAGLCEDFGARKTRLGSAGVDALLKVGHAARRLVGRTRDETCLAPMTLSEIRELIESSESG